MADLLVSSAPAEPVRICPACGDVLVSGICSACAPPPARAYHERATLPTLGKGLVDSRRAAAEWSVSPEDLDPHTRKAHPSQLQKAPRDYELPEPTPRGKRQTQVYRKGGAAALASPIPAPARTWALPEPSPEPTPEGAQAASTARHARPVSPLRPASGPVSLPTPAVAAPLAPDALAEQASPAALASFVPATPAPAAVETAPAAQTPEDGDSAWADPETELDPVARAPVHPLVWLVLAAGLGIGVLAALV